MKYWPMNRLKNSTTLLVFLEKGGQKWEVKLNKEHTPMKSIKTFFTACHHKNDNSSRDKLRQDSGEWECSLEVSFCFGCSFLELHIRHILNTMVH